MKRYNSMLEPNINELKKVMGNRYLLVNVAAQRAGMIAHKAEEMDENLDSKPVTIALHEIADGKIKVVPEEESAPITDGEEPEEEPQQKSGEYDGE